ncbi:MAG: hypothetical protein ACI9LO_000232 [Planctomycetota bacterium]|jgi:hypothetical protein
MAKKKTNYQHPDDPLKFEDHGRPVTRREFIRQGFMTGSATILTGGMFNLFANPNVARAAIAPDLQALAASMPNCSPGGIPNTMIPFICFDLAGGANLAGSNVLVGQGGGQLDFLSTAGYSKLGIPGDMVPGLDDSSFTDLNNSSNGDFTNTELNLAFHADSPILRGIRERAPTITSANIDGCVIPARSDNDTGNNPHNPLYGIAMAGGTGTVVDLIGSRSSESGGNSMAPAALINPEVRPTKVDRPSDVTGMVDVGDLTAILSDPADVTAVMESIARLSHRKMQVGDIQTKLTNDAIIKDLVRCGYLKAADIADRFAGIPVDPLEDIEINQIFTANELTSNEFRKTASVMKMVIEGYAAGGCITMGGYDYHTGDRITGENRDLRAGRCIGACLDYARRKAQPLMIYVYSDGSVASNGMPDDSLTIDNNDPETLILGGQGKGQWTGDNSSTACSFFLVYNPFGSPGLIGNRQIGRMDAGGSVVTSATPAANNVNILVNMLLLNYMSVSGPAPFNLSDYTDIFPNHGLGTNLSNYIAFDSF